MTMTKLMYNEGKLKKKIRFEKDEIFKCYHKRSLRAKKEEIIKRHISIKIYLFSAKEMGFDSDKLLSRRSRDDIETIALKI